MAAVRRKKKAAKSETRRRKEEKSRSTRRNTKREIGSRGGLKTSRDRSLIGEIVSEWLLLDLIIHQRDETPPAITAATRRGTATATISTAREVVVVTLDRTTATAKEVIEDIKSEIDRSEAGAVVEEEVMDIISGGVVATGMEGTTTGGTGEREGAEVEDIIITGTKVTTDEIMPIPTPSPVTTRKTRDPTITRKRKARAEILTTAGRRARLAQRMLEFVIIIKLTFSNQSCVESLYAYDYSIELNEIKKQ